MRLINKMKERKITLVYSSPKNDYELVRTAWENGADAVKVHLNVHHHASDNNFGNYCQEKEVLLKILSDSPVPVGVVLGGNPSSVVEDFAGVMTSGFDFCSLYFHHTPSEIYQQNKMTIMSACDYTYDIDEINQCVSLGAEILEASIVPPNDYGQYLTMRDVSKYAEIKSRVSIPVLIPTQKKVRLKDLSMLKKSGIDALMLGTIVTGDTINSVSSTIAAFRNELDKDA